MCNGEHIDLFPWGQGFSMKMNRSSLEATSYKMLSYRGLENNIWSKMKKITLTNFVFNSEKKVS